MRKDAFSSARACTGLFFAFSFVLTWQLPQRAYAKENNKVQGAQLFGSTGCAHCHGAQGEGTEQGPSLRDVRKRLKPDEMEHQIVAGGKAMPAFGDTLDHTQVESLVAFLRAKKWVTVPAPAPTK